MATNGNNILVYNGSTLIAGTQYNEAQTEAELIETSSSTQNKYRTYVAGRNSGTITVGFLLMAKSALGISGGTGIRDLLQEGKTFTLVMKTRNGQDSDGISGTYILQKVTIRAQRFNLVQGSFQFVLNGAPQ